MYSTQVDVVDKLLFHQSWDHYNSAHDILNHILVHVRHRILLLLHLITLQCNSHKHSANFPISYTLRMKLFKHTVGPITMPSSTAIVTSGSPIFNSSVSAVLPY